MHETSHLSALLSLVGKKNLEDALDFNFCALSGYSLNISLLTFSFRMEDDLKARMDKDLTNKMDRLFLMKLQPALYLSQRIDEIVSTIDYSAEQRLDNERSWEKTSYSTYFNQARCEMIRIVKAVEKNLHNQLLFL